MSGHVPHVLWSVTASLLLACPAVAGEPDLAAGERTYQQTCVACHGPSGRSPIPGVPDLGGDRSPLGKPVEVLVEHVLNGYRSEGSTMAMPPRGGNPNLTESEIRCVIEYMRQRFLKESS